MADTWRARRINTMLGFGAIRPWEISQLDELWLEALDGLAKMEKDEAALAEVKNDFEARLREIRNQNPSYRTR